MKRFHIPRFETLEHRHLMADCGVHNLQMPEDVNNDRTVSPVDALVLINQLNRDASSSLCQASGEGDGPGEGESLNFVDVNNDGWLTPLDALQVINQLNVSAENARLFSANSLQYATQFSAKDSVEANLLTTGEVQTLLTRASQASPSTDAIIAIVDRSGRILGVRVEAGVSNNLKSDPAKLAFAIDGAVAKARTAAFFSSNEAPLTSRTVRFISQSTMTQREVESSPNNSDPTLQGPGFVAPIGVGGHFPPEVASTPQVDLFAIEHQSRDSRRLNGLDGVRGSGDDVNLVNRFNAQPATVPALAQDFFNTWPESYGVASGTDPIGQSRGIGTLPGGVPLFKDAIVNGAKSFNLVGGIGVFFPGEDGFATYEQGFKHQSQNGNVPQRELERNNAPRVLEAEFIAVIAAAGRGFFGPSAFVRDVSEFNAKLAPLPNFFLPTGRIDLVGITLEIYGPNPTTAIPMPGIDRLISVGRALKGNGSQSGNDVKVNAGGDLYLKGQPVPELWLVKPHDSSDGKLKAADIEKIVYQAVAQADLTRAAIRLDVNNNFRPGVKTKMVISIADTNGELLGVYRMPDSTVFSIDVSIAKARNTAYYADAAALQPQDRVDFNADGVFGQVTTSLVGGDTLPLGTALTNRTFRFLAEPRYPTGINLPATAANGLVSDPNKRLVDQRPDIAALVGPQSMLQLPGINPLTGENIGNVRLPVSVYKNANSASTVAFDAFNPSRNFRDPGDGSVKIAGTNISYRLANQNGIVFSPGSTSVYVGGSILAGGFGVSGDGVDQDDVVTAAGQISYAAPDGLRVDNYSIGSVRLPFQKFNRNPTGA